MIRNEELPTHFSLFVTHTCTHSAKLIQAKPSQFGEAGCAVICSWLNWGIALPCFLIAKVLTRDTCIFSNAQFSLWQLQVQCLHFFPPSSGQFLLGNTSSSQLPVLVSMDSPVEYLSPVHYTQEFHFIARCVRVGHCNRQTTWAKNTRKNEQQKQGLKLHMI